MDGDGCARPARASMLGLAPGGSAALGDHSHYLGQTERGPGESISAGRLVAMRTGSADRMNFRIDLSINLKDGTAVGMIS